jgi:hypothetical protein
MAQALLLGDVKAPRPGPANPATCPMCGDLAKCLGTALKARDGLQASHVVRVTQVHVRMSHGTGA